MESSKGSIFQPKTTYEMRISDWSSVVCSSDLLLALAWRRIRTLEFASAEKLIGAAEMAIETRISDQIYDSYDGDRMRNMLRHRRIMLEAGRDNMTGIEQEAEALLADLGDEEAFLGCTLLRSEESRVGQTCVRRCIYR